MERERKEKRRVVRRLVGPQQSRGSGVTRLLVRSYAVSLMSASWDHPEESSSEAHVEAFDDSYQVAHPLGVSTATLMSGFDSSNGTPSVAEDEEDEIQGRPVDITKFHGPTTSSEVKEMRARRAEKSGHLVEACATLIECLGEDLKREGLLKTPNRMAKALQYFTSGYDTCLSGTLQCLNTCTFSLSGRSVWPLLCIPSLSLRLRSLLTILVYSPVIPLEIMNGAVFTVDTDDLVVVRDVDLFSMCEHHLVPFFGKMHVGYLPKGKVLGLSKVARIAEVFSRRLQVQERLTREVAQAVMKSIGAAGVAVVIECTHLCMVMRGVQKVSSNTVTSCMLGEFRDNPNTRREFLSLISRTQYYR